MSKSKDTQESEPNSPLPSDADETDEENDDNEEDESEDENEDSEPTKSKVHIDFGDDPEDIPETIDDESDEDQAIPESDTDEEDETEYKRGENEGSDDDESEEIENEENDQPEEDEILETIVGDDDEADDNDGQGADDAPDEIFGDGDEDAGEEVKKRRTTSRSKVVKRRLFPFIQAKRKAVQSELRDPPIFYAARVRVRQETAEYLQTEGKLDAETTKRLEKAIATATARIFKSEGVQPVVQSVIFKERYIEILRYVIGALMSLTVDEIVNELAADNYGYKSSLYSAQHQLDKEIEDKIKNPDDVTEDANYPCPKCGGIKHTRLLIQDRSGDEGASLTLWCESKTCGKKWKIRG